VRLASFLTLHGTCRQGLDSGAAAAARTSLAEPLALVLLLLLLAASKNLAKAAPCRDLLLQTSPVHFHALNFNYEWSDATRSPTCNKHSNTATYMNHSKLLCAGFGRNFHCILAGMVVRWLKHKKRTARHTGLQVHQDAAYCL
jgi:hypothetical protein